MGRAGVTEVLLEGHSWVPGSISEMGKDTAQGREAAGVVRRLTQPQSD